MISEELTEGTRMKTDDIIVQKKVRRNGKIETTYSVEHSPQNVTFIRYARISDMVTTPSGDILYKSKPKRVALVSKGHSGGLGGGVFYVPLKSLEIV